MTRFFRLALIFAAAGGLFGPPSLAQSTSTDYAIGPQDVLAIVVFDQPELSGKYAVEIDGSFTFPYIGRVKAGGLTIRAFEHELRTRLGDGFFKDPQIAVSVESYRSQRIFVTGEVRTPGAFPLTGELTLLDVAGVRAAMEYAGTPYEVINLGNNQTVSLQEMIDGIQRALGVRAITTHLPEQPGDVPQTWANVDKAAAVLGYQPHTRFERGIERFADWLKSAPALIGSTQ